MATKVMNPTQLQAAIINEALYGDGNIVVSAAPGSGKTTLLSMVTKALLDKNPNYQIFAVSYTNSIKETLTEKLDSRCSIFSLHQIGLSLLKNSKINRKFQPNPELHGKGGSPDNKYKIIYRDIVDQDFPLRTEGKIAYPLINECVELTNKMRLELADFDKSSEIERVARKYNLNCNETHINYIRQGIERGIETYRYFGWCDFIDMVYLPIYFDCKPTKGMFIGNKEYSKKVSKIDFILVDEFQDASPIIHKVIEKFSNTFNSRLILVGDPNQSCFGFSGAHSNSMGIAEDYFKCKKLPLNETFRLPESHVKYINDLFGTDIVSKRGIEGKINIITESDMMKYVEPGDMVLSRTNEELYTCFLRLLNNRIPARLIKLDLIRYFDEMFDKIERENPKLWMDVYAGIREYVTVQTINYTNKYNAFRAQELIAELNNNAEVLFAYLDFFNPNNRADFFHQLKILMDNNDRSNYVSLLTVHTGKGLESKNVFVLNASQFPYIRDGMDAEAAQQERNVRFVALSRSLETMYLVD